MEVYLLRHAIAVPRGTPGFKDEERPLTENGRKKMISAAKGLTRIISKVDVIITSPLKRAYETAIIVAKSLDQEEIVVISELFKPGIIISEILNGLIKYNNKKQILIVGHEPDLSFLAANLTGLKHAVFELKKGGCCAIEIDGFPPRQPGYLKWLLKPSHLRMLGHSRA